MFIVLLRNSKSSSCNTKHSFFICTHTREGEKRIENRCMRCIRVMSIQEIVPIGTIVIHNCVVMTLWRTLSYYDTLRNTKKDTLFVPIDKNGSRWKGNETWICELEGCLSLTHFAWAISTKFVIYLCKHHVFLCSTINWDYFRPLWSFQFLF